MYVGDPGSTVCSAIFEDPYGCTVHCILKAVIFEYFSEKSLLSSSCTGTCTAARDLNLDFFKVRAWPYLLAASSWGEIILCGACSTGYCTVLRTSRGSETVCVPALVDLNLVRFLSFSRWPRPAKKQPADRTCSARSVTGRYSYTAIFAFVP